MLSTTFLVWVFLGERYTYLVPAEMRSPDLTARSHSAVLTTLSRLQGIQTQGYHTVGTDVLN